MTTTIINPDTLHDPTGFGYSHVAFPATSSQLTYIGGQYASDLNGHTTSTDFATQVRQSFENLGLALRAAGLGYDDVVRIGTYVVGHDEAKLEAVLEVISGIWSDHPPAQTLIGVASLALPEMQFEVDAVAARSLPR